MIALIEASGLPLPSDGNTVAIIILVLLFAARELWDLLKRKADQERRKAEAERAAEVNSVAKLEAKFDSLASDVRASLRELTNTQANQHADLAVALQRITSLELQVAKLTDVRKAGA